MVCIKKSIAWKEEKENKCCIFLWNYVQYPLYASFKLSQYTFIVGRIFFDGTRYLMLEPCPQPCNGKKFTFVFNY
jgi:hypothetical protein